MIDKIKTYVGFAIKSNSVIMGVDNIIKKAKVPLVIISSKLSQNSLSKLKTKTETKIIVLDDCLPEGVRALAITNENLASEIIKLA